MPFTACHAAGPWACASTCSCAAAGMRVVYAMVMQGYVWPALVVVVP